MLLIGINNSFTKKPMNPITAKPKAHDVTMRMYSLLFGLLQRLMSCRLSLTNSVVAVRGFDQKLSDFFCLLIFITTTWLFNHLEPPKPRPILDKRIK